MSNDEFEPNNYEDEYHLRVLALIDNKVKGGAITAPPKTIVKRGAVIDLMEALRQSMKKIPEKKAAAPKTRKKA
ncbi:MAG TPA: hypothetical protein VEQ38_25360 [Verrucomicrobiae bacterium]|nr:hypothetical protein [Verrucomicrobiae bacterium]